MNTPFVRCYSTLGCPEYSLKQTAELALQFQVPLLELRALENRLDLPEVLREFPGGWTGAREFLDANRLRVQVIGTSFHLTGWEEKSWNELLRQAELAETLGAPFLRVFGGGSWEIDPTGEGLEKAAAILQRWRAERSRRGWKTDVLVETHDAFSSSPRLLTLLEKIGEPVSILWDCHHTWRLACEPPAETWKALGAYVKHVHFKDSRNVPAPNESPYTYTLPGRGEMPFPEVLRVLREGNYPGALSLEWEKKWHPYLEPMPEALAACRDAGWW